MTQILGFALGFLLSVGTVVYLTGEESWRDSLCKLLPICGTLIDIDSAVATAASTAAAIDKRAPADTETETKTDTQSPPGKNQPTLAVTASTENTSAEESAQKEPEQAPIAVRVPPIPDVWTLPPDTAAASEAPPAAPAVTTTTATGDGSGEQQQHIFWPAFNNAVSAAGFAELVNEKTGLDIAVIKQKPGAYAVAFNYLNAQQLQQSLDMIELQVGVKPLAGVRP